jgi:hypothetical protein
MAGRSKFSRSSEEASEETETDPDWRRNLSNDMFEVAEQLDKKMQDAQVFGGMRAAVDRSLLAPSYLASEPFLRLELRAPDLTIGTPDASLSDSIAMWLTVHRSGTFLLTMGIPLPQTPVADLAELAKMKTAGVRASILPEPVLRLAWGRGRRLPKGLAGTRESEERSGTYWWSFDHSDAPVTIEDVFEVYLSALQRALGRRTRLEPDWFCYSTLVLNSPACCSTKGEWLAHHHGDATTLAVRSAEYAQRLEPDAARLDDQSDLTTHFLHLSSGNAVEVNFPDASEGSDYHLADDLMLLGPIEHAVLQFGQLLALDRQTLRIDPSSSPEAAQRSLAVGLEEFARPILTSGTARDQANALEGEMRLSDYLSHLRGRVDTLAQLTSAAVSRTSGRRNLAIAFLTLLAMAMFALPAIEDSVTILFEPADPRVWARRLYVFVLMLLAALVLLPLVSRLRVPRFRGSRRLGYLWRGEGLHVSMRGSPGEAWGESSAPDGDRGPVGRKLDLK